MTQSERTKLMESRLEIVSGLYKRAHTYREIQREVMNRLGLKSYSLKTVKDDIERLLARWREQELASIGEYVKLELARIDEAVRELWTQWEKSKEDYKKNSKKSKGKHLEPKAASEDDNTDTPEIRTIEREVQQTEMRCLGDVSYIAEIRAQLVERRKLLGLYAPEKREVTGKDGESLFQGITIQKTYDDKTVEKTDAGV